MAVAGIIASLKITGKSLRQNIFLFQGAGEVSFYLLSYLDKYTFIYMHLFPDKIYVVDI